MLVRKEQGVQYRVRDTLIRDFAKATTLEGWQNPRHTIVGKADGHCSMADCREGVASGPSRTQRRRPLPSGLATRNGRYARSLRMGVKRETTLFPGLIHYSEPETVLEPRP